MSWFADSKMWPERQGLSQRPAALSALLRQLLLLSLCCSLRLQKRQ